MLHGKIKPYYLQYNNEEIRCTLIIKNKLPGEEKPVKIRFQRYIVGRPNLLTIPIRVSSRNIDPMIRDNDVEFAQYIYEVDVWCKNDDYPVIFEVDSRMIQPSKPYKIIDLQMSLPEGMWLHRKYDRLLYNGIFGMGENFNLIISNTLYPVDEIKEKEDTEELADEAKQLQTIMGSKTKEKKKKTVTMPFTAASSKKIMQAKNEGADKKAIRQLAGKGPGDKKGGKKPAEKKPPADSSSA
jgi:hypothetical protein